MDAAELIERLRADNQTELSRLGSSKLLYAQTGGDLKPPAVLAAAADRTYHAAELVDGWQGSGDDELDSAFERVAETVRAHHATIVEEVSAYEPGPEPAILAALADLEGPVERAGGLLAWTLVADREMGQRTGFFTGQADPTTASTFREIRSDYDDLRDALAAALDAHCGSAAEWAAAEAGASAAIEAAYAAYVESLEAMGVNPKPVC